MLPGGYVSGIRVSHIRIVVAARIVGICGIAWLDFEGNVDVISLFCDDAISTVSTVERHRHGAIAGTVDAVYGRISARQLGTAVLHRHILRDVGTVGDTCELDRIHPLGQGVGDGDDLDLRGRGNGGIDLVECFRQILSVRAVKFLAIHCIGFSGEIGHLIRISGSLHHIECGIATFVSLSQGGSIVETVCIAISCTVRAIGTTIRIFTPHVPLCLAGLRGRIFRMSSPPIPKRIRITSAVRGRTVCRIAIREEDDVLLHTRAAFQIVCLLERGLPVGAAVGVTLHGVVDFRGVRGERLLEKSVSAECHYRHTYLLIIRQR